MSVFVRQDQVGWERSIKVLHMGRMYGGDELLAVADAGDLVSGMVVNLVNGEFVIADSTADGGGFFGLAHSEDWTDGVQEISPAGIPLVAWTEDGVYEVLKDALETSGGALVGGYALGVAASVDLVVGTGTKRGKLIVRPGGNTNPAVAKLIKVNTNSIVVQLLQASVTA